jgi:hypothetical protein
MIIAVWDYLFARRVWTIIKEEPLYGITIEDKMGLVGYVYVLQDQFGNLRRKKI